MTSYLKFIGEVSSQPVSKPLTSGEDYCYFSLYCPTEQITDFANTDKTSHFVRIIAFGGLAKAMCERLSVGASVYLEAKIGRPIFIQGPEKRRIIASNNGPVQHGIIPGDVSAPALYIAKQFRLLGTQQKPSVIVEDDPSTIPAF